MSSINHCPMDFINHICIQAVCIYVLSVKCSETVTTSVDPDNISITVDTKVVKEVDTIQLDEPPDLIQNLQKVTIKYHCSDNKLFGIEVIADKDSSLKHRLFYKAWRCQKTQATTKHVRLKLRLPSRFMFRPDFIHPNYEYLSGIKIRVWIVDSWQWETAKTQHDAYSRALVKTSYNTNLHPPFSRPKRTSFISCVSWKTKMLIEISTMNIPKCPHEEETMALVKYPAVMNGLPYGIYRTFGPFNNPEMEARRQSMLKKPSMTISMWLYILDYCPHSSLCSVLAKITWDGHFQTPLLFINKEGHFHVQVLMTNGETNAALPHFQAPRHQWFRVVFSLDKSKWTMSFNYGQNYNETVITEYSVPGEILLDDTTGMFVIGGFENTRSFRGYVGQATYYRNRILVADQVPFPSPYHPMFELKLNRREQRCKAFWKWILERQRALAAKRQKEHQEKTSQIYVSRFLAAKNLLLPASDTCSPHEAPVPRAYKYVNKILQKGITTANEKDMKEIGRELYNKTIKKIDADVKMSKRLLPIVKQAACLGDTDAMFHVAVALNNGFLVKADEMQALAYLMMASLENHRLSAMSIANKHMYGLDGIHTDLDQAYIYYKYVADTTREDRETHKETDVITESVRLTDEVVMREQTDEEGDVFNWLKHQAQKGVFSAQQHVARALFWGSQGLKRNMGAAVEYFKMTAETKDPVALYDYGILLVRGQGVQKNVSEGLSHIKMSAEKKNPAAINALGWYALNFDKNVSQAVQYFEEAYKMGNADAANSLGILHLHGSYPNQKVDADKALQYFNFAAVRGQFDAGVYVAYMNHKGTARMKREIRIATEWARYIAEKNPHIGSVLRKALHSYRNGDHFLSTFYYMMAAETGIEVGTFNLAWLCEENKEGMVSFIEKDCQWKNYNLSTKREPQFVDSYALLKMGDYYFYGCGNERDVKKAAEVYAQAAQKGEPHAIFNIGFMLEDGAHIHQSVWQKLLIPNELQNSKFHILHHLYSRCRDSPKTEAYIPCTISLYRILVSEFWNQHKLLLEVMRMLIWVLSWFVGGLAVVIIVFAWAGVFVRQYNIVLSFVIILMVTSASLYSIFGHLRQIPQTDETDDIL